MDKPIMKRIIKSSNSELQNRVDIMIEYLAQKMKRAQIIELVSTVHREWRVSKNTVDNYLRKARNQLLEQVRATRKELRGEACNDLRYLYKKCLEGEDYSTALRVRKELSDMFVLKGAALDEQVQGERDVTLPDGVEKMFEDNLEIENPIEEPVPVQIPLENRIAKPGRPAKPDTSLERFGY